MSSSAVVVIVEPDISTSVNVPLNTEATPPTPLIDVTSVSSTVVPVIDVFSSAIPTIPPAQPILFVIVVPSILESVISAFGVYPINPPAC